MRPVFSPDDRFILSVLSIILTFILLGVVLMIVVKADTPIVVTTAAASGVAFNGATLNGNLVDLGMAGVPPTRVQGPAVATGPGFNTVATINSASSNLLLIIVGRAFVCGSLTSVTTSPADTVQQIPNADINIPSLLGNISGAFFVVNPQNSPTYQVTAAWSSGSCSYGTKYLALYTFSGVNTTSPIVNNANTTGTAFNGFSPPYTISFPAPASHQVSVFTEAVTDTAQNFNDIHLVNMTGLANAWTYGSTANCGSGGGFCPSGGIGISRTAVTATNNNINFAAVSWFINGTTAPRASVDVFFQWGDTTNLGNETTHVAKSAPTSFAVFLVLNASTTYYFRACGSSPISCGSILSFTTPADLVRQYTWAFWVMVFLIALTIVAAGAYKLRERL